MQTGDWTARKTDFSFLSNEIKAKDASLFGFICMVLLFKSMHIWSLNQCFWRSNQSEIATIRGAAIVIHWMIRICKTCLYFAYLQRKKHLLTNTPNIKRFFVKNIYHQGSIFPDWRIVFRHNEHLLRKFLLNFHCA